MKYSLLGLVILLPILSFSKATTESLVKKMDELFRSDSSIATMKMQVITPDYERTMRMEIWTQGMDYTFITILAPRKDKGVSTLKRKNEMWNYFPKINKVIKVPPSMMMGSWMGSDLTNDDLVKDSTLLDDYTVMLKGEATPYYVLELKPKAETVSLWGKIEIQLDKKSELPIKQIFYDEKGLQVRVMNFKDVKKVGRKEIPMTIELLPVKKPGNRTVITYEKIKFDIPITKKTFTRSNLQKRR